MRNRKERYIVAVGTLCRLMRYREAQKKHLFALEGWINGQWSIIHKSDDLGHIANLLVKSGAVCSHQKAISLLRR